MESLRFHRTSTSLSGKKRIHRAFTLVELVVVSAIIVVITGLILNSQSSFNKTLVLANTAYDMALTFRSAETYGLSSRVFGGISNAGYGIHIDTASNNSFILFSDIDPPPSGLSCYGALPPGGATSPDAKYGDCIYTAGSDIQASTYTLGNGIFIEDFCAYSVGAWTCANALGGGLAALDILFARPNPDPFINGDRTGMACITISSADGGFRYIWVGTAGAITVSDTICR